MCQVCDENRATRRSLLGLVGAATIASLATPAFAAGGAHTSLDADEAMAALKAGNQRFVANPQACVANLAMRRTEVAKGQAPWATIVSCADSRVPPELIFGGLNVGELFVIRNAGNTVDNVAMGTLEYGAAVLGSPLIVVMGHSKCGAVAAACDVVTKNATFPGMIGPMIEPIIPAALAVRAQGGDMVDNAVRENVRRTVRELKATGPIVGKMAEEGKIKIVGARYDLETGAVEFFA